MRRKLARYGVLLAIAVMGLGCAPAAPPETEATLDAPLPAHAERDVDALLVVLRDRLRLMHDVAEFKRRAELPVTDTARERQVLDQTAEAGRWRGLDADWTVAVVRAQIDAGKLIQERDLSRPSVILPQPVQAPDLATTIRPQIDALGERLLDALLPVQRWRDDHRWRQLLRERAPQVLEGDGIDDEVRRIAIKPLIE
ncbi:MAG: gamma subclass chorismate mutase AroQ [Planctomycetes bacterium]|nr:gamma subclass chorismate mutase AroQ [Planctomycetota bacterium]